MEKLQLQVNILQAELNLLKSVGTFPYDVESAIRERLLIDRFEGLLLLPSELQDAPLAAISSPTGGATVDTEARTAINTIIARLQSLGLVL